MALVAGVLYALHPATTGTALWLADRFDLLATAAVLWGLIALARAIAGEGRRLWVFVAATIAAGCKETAVVLPLIAAGVLLLASERPRRWRLQCLLAVAAPFALMLVARHRVLQGVETTLAISDLTAATAAGVWHWLVLLPTAVIGFGADGANRTVVALVLAAALGAAGLRLRGADIRLVRLAAAGVGLACLPALVQSPVTSIVLAPADALANPVNARFYYLALAGLAVLLAAGYAAQPRRVVHAAMVATICAALALVWLPTARNRAQAWAQASAGPERAVAEAVTRLVAGLAVEPGCKLYLFDTATSAPGFSGFADTATKAALAPDAPALRCVILTERAPWYTITREAGCDDARWLPLAPRRNGAHTLAARRIGPLCFHYFADPVLAPVGDDAQARFFRYDAGAFIEIDAPAVWKRPANP